MTEIVNRLRDEFPGAFGEWREMSNGSEYQRRMGSYLELVDRARLVDICFYLRDAEDLQFNNLILISTVDNADGTLSIVYHLESTSNFYHVAIKATMPSTDAVMPTITPVWSHANWLEREAWDMMGFRFTGHPDPRRIYLEEDWVGHPLRKDFKTPEFYHGMKVPY